MDKLIKTTALSLLLATTGLATGEAAEANVAHQMGNVTHLMRAVAVPSDGRVESATHKIKLHVAGQQLSQLKIAIPRGISQFGEIKVMNQSGKEVDTTVAVIENEAQIAFARPVSPGTMLSIEISQVRTGRGNGNTWVYRVSGQVVGLNSQTIPFGTALIHTDAD